MQNLKITKGMKVKYNSERSVFDGCIYEVLRTGNKKTVLSPVKPSLTNPAFNIDTQDFIQAISVNYYSIV